ncbi:MAG: hypothetical protein AB2705_15240 [Candidatus Thiodiazotropha sp.]
MSSPTIPSNPLCTQVRRNAVYLNGTAITTDSTAIPAMEPKPNRAVSAIPCQSVSVVVTVSITNAADPANP